MRKTVKRNGLLILFLVTVVPKKKILNMKKITIELTEEQYAKMTNYLQKGTALNVDNDTFSGYGLHLNCVEGGIASWLEVEMNGSLNLGDVNWNIE
jgi:hypothetical protein